MRCQLGAPANSELLIQRASAPGELDPSHLQQKVDANQASFPGVCTGTTGAETQAPSAVDARDPKRLFDIGGEINKVCDLLQVEL